MFMYQKYLIRTIHSSFFLQNKLFELITQIHKGDFVLKNLKWIFVAFCQTKSELKIYIELKV